MGLKERIAARNARREAKATSLVTPVANEPPDQTAAAESQLDPQLFRDEEARAKAAAEINEARRQWAAGPAKVLAGNR